MTEINSFIQKDVPRIIGKTSVDFFKENFINQGFIDRGLEKWQPAKRTLYKDKYAASQYGTLLSSRTELMNSITYRADKGLIVILSDKEYASIHNEGGNINIPVTTKMRKFAWKRYFDAGKQSDEAQKWKGLALTKKSAISINMPQRKFIGDSEALTQQNENKIETKMTAILNF